MSHVLNVFLVPPKSAFFRPFWTGPTFLRNVRLSSRAAKYEGVSKSFWTGRLERELHMLQLSATMCSCVAILWGRHTPLCCVSVSVYYCCLFRYRLSPETYGYILVPVAYMAVVCFLSWRQTDGTYVNKTKRLSTQWQRMEEVSFRAEVQNFRKSVDNV